MINKSAITLLLLLLFFSIPLIASPSNRAAKGKAAVSFAIRQLGKCYSRSKRLRKGPICFDCSGLVYTAWKRQGIILPERTRFYPASNLKQISSIAKSKAGDLLWRKGHVGMVVGKNLVVHSTSRRGGVVLETLKEFGKYSVIYRPGV